MLREPSGNEKLSFRTLFRIYRVFGRHYLKHWKYLTFAYAGLMVTTFLGLLSPWPLKLILDSVILKNPMPKRMDFLLKWIPNDPHSLLIALVVGFFIISSLQSFISFIYKLGTAIVGSKMVGDFRERLFARLQQLSLTFHKSAKSGDIVYRMTSDVSQVQVLLIQVPQAMIKRLLVIFSYVGLMLALNWHLAMVAFSVIPIIYIFNHRFGTGVQRATRKKRNKESEVTSIISENVTSMALVKAYGREDLQQARFQKENQLSLRSTVRALQLSKVFKRLNEILIAAGTAGVLYYGGVLSFEGALLPGTIVLFVSYLKNLYGPLDSFAEMIMQIAVSQVACDRLLDIMDNELVLEDDPGAIEAPPLRGRIEFDNVSFRYTEESEVLQEINLTIDAGQTIALVGHSGAGKSTLISLLLRFYDPQKGRVFIDGEDIRHFTLKSLRQQITILMQDARLFDETVYENIAFGKSGATEEEVIRAAKLAQAHDFICELPQGYQTRIAQGGDNLSGGQRQRINIARAVIRNTPIVILDEPSTALDVETESRLNAAIRELTKGKTTIIVAHKFSTLANADKIIFLHNGRCLAFGSHAELLEQNAEYAELFRLQYSLSPGGGADLSQPA